MGGKAPRGDGFLLLHSSRARALAVGGCIGIFLLLFAPLAYADCGLTDPTCTVDQAKRTATAAATGAGGSVDGTINPVKNKAGAAVKQITDTVNGVLNPGGGGGGGGHHGGGGGSGTTRGRGAAAPTASGVGALNQTAINGVSTPASNRSQPATPSAANGPTLIGRIGGAAAEAAKQVAFPLALALVVLIFLVIQNRLDRRDPKLALAPIEPDVLRFS